MDRNEQLKINDAIEKLMIAKGLPNDLRTYALLTEAVDVLAKVRGEVY